MSSSSSSSQSYTASGDNPLNNRDINPIGASSSLGSSDLFYIEGDFYGD